MKLRNKKTDEIVDGFITTILWRDKLRVSHRGGQPYADYDSLAELNEVWEDYEIAEPLIKDEKIRKAVRAWAEAFNVNVAYLAPIGDGSKYVELFNEDSDGFERIAIPAENIKQEQCYTIAELCGEEGDDD